MASEFIAPVGSENQAIAHAHEQLLYQLKRRSQHEHRQGERFLPKILKEVLFQHALLE